MATFEGRFSDASGLRIAVIVARFNDLVTAKLLSGCLDCLHRHGVDTSAESRQLDVAWVPGSFELPLVAQQLARSGRYQVVITLGAVIRGDTLISMWWSRRPARESLPLPATPVCP